MNDYCEINLEAGMPIVADAMRYLQDSLNHFRREKRKCVLIIHGYGSSGSGGAIGRKARQWLKAQESCGKIKAVVFGEDMSIFTPKALELKHKYRGLEQYMERGNHGITIIEL